MNLEIRNKDCPGKNMGSIVASTLWGSQQPSHFNLRSPPLEKTQNCTVNLVAMKLIDSGTELVTFILLHGHSIKNAC